MENQFEHDEDERLRREQRQKRIAEMKKQKERRELLQGFIKRYGIYCGGVLLAILLIWIGVSLSHNHAEAKENNKVVAEAEQTEDGAVDVTRLPYEDIVEEAIALAEVAPAEEIPADIVEEESYITVGDVTFKAGYDAEATLNTVNIGDTDVNSSYAILVDASTGEIVAQKDAKTIISPASMTKILTVLVAAEHVTDLDDTFTMTLEITDYAYVNDCSSVGFLNDETVTVRDLFYGTILPSGGDAAVALATYVAGSQEAFVDLMNAKLEELGLSETAHFTNCVGLYDKEHYCSVYDMAMILKAAVENDLCREVLGTRVYTTTATTQHPEGITISNWFIRRIEDKDTGGKVLGAKTGFVNQSGSCAASYEVSDGGTPYICVTAQAYSSWRCIYDHVAMYKLYAK